MKAKHYLFIFLILILFLKSNAQKNDSNIVINTFVSEVRDKKIFKTYHRKSAIPNSVKKKLEAINKEISFSNHDDNYVFRHEVSWRDRFHKRDILTNIIKSDKIAIINYYHKWSFNRHAIPRTLICLYDKNDASVFVIRAVFTNVFELYNCIISNNYDIWELEFPDTKNTYYF
jgi:hypothetical protein